MPDSARRSEVTVHRVQSEADLFSALAIREVVFIEEQSVPESLERDEADATAYHLLAMQAGHAVGTGRLVMLPEPPSGQSGLWGRVGRMAVLKSHRKAGVGSRVLLGLEEEARRRGCAGILLHAQVFAVPFYQGHGYGLHGGEFDEAGIPHVEMLKRLS
jgi:predicted GNAT family N-acyltransferase